MQSSNLYPATNLAELEIVDESTLPSLTYLLSEGRLVGMVDGGEAIAQAIHKILNTELGKCLIYSDNYGIDLDAMLGRSQSVAISEAKRVICEALLADGRIISVDDFVFTKLSKGALGVSFTVSTIFGNLHSQKEVNI